MNAVQIEKLNHIYTTKKQKSRQVLNDLNLNVPAGEIFGLLGPNGGGKTTLFRILSTAMIPSSGTVSVFGLDLIKNPELVRRKIGVVFQNPSLDKKLTLFENIQHQGHLYGLRGSTLTEKINALLRKLSLLDRAPDLVEQLSGGLQRRGEIAKGLLHQPDLLLMDEPSTGLDPGARREMWELLFELKKQGVTIMLTTHLMEEGEKCDRLVILHRGRCVAAGTPSDLKKRIGGDLVVVQTKEPESLGARVREKFSHDVHVLANTLRIEIKDGHKFIPLLVEAFPGMIEAVSVGKPTLEDVFVHETGQRFGGDVE